MSDSARAPRRRFPSGVTVAALAIVDDHGLVAETLRMGLTARGIDSVRVAPAGPAELVPALLALRPRLVLLDLDLGAAGDSTPAIGRLAAAGLRTVVFTGTTDRLRIAAALEAGAIATLSKSEEFDVLVRTVAGGTGRRRVAGPARAGAPAGRTAPRARRTGAERWAAFRRLTDREQATLRELARGRTVQQIARDWVVSEATMRTHVRRVLEKLQVGSQLGAVARAMEVGWLE